MTARLLVLLVAGACVSEPTPPLPGFEVCDGIDNDLDDRIDDGFDADSDGYPTCAAEPAYDDCDDADRSVHPFALELCDHLDNDCDGVLPMDERDLDGDGHMGCAGDCDDLDTSMHPGDEDNDGYSPCMGDCDDADPGRSPEALEVCNGLDDNCDGLIPADELDRDGDGQASCAGDCDDSDPTVENRDRDGDGYATCGAMDCDDSDPDVHGNAVEQCNGMDDDCDGDIDEGCP